MQRDARALIDGEWVADATHTRDNLNPATGEVIGTYPELRADDVIAAVDAATRAVESWRATPVSERAAILAKAQTLLAEQLDILAEVVTAEQGKTLCEAVGELWTVGELLERAAREGREIAARPGPGATQVRRRRRGVGVVAVLTPWSLPAALPAREIGAALVTGNAVLFKPASLTPLTAELIVDTFTRAGLPAGVLNLIQGAGEAVGQALVHDRRVAAVSVVGSRATARRVRLDVTGRDARTRTDVGGTGTVILLADGDLEATANTVVGSAFRCAGQSAAATGRVVVSEAMADALVEQLVARAKALVLGDGMDPDVTTGPTVDSHQMNRALTHVAVARDEGARLCCGGDRVTGNGCDRGFFVAPTVLDGVTPGMRIAREEVFGPVVSVLRVDDDAGAVATANALGDGRGVSVYSSDPDRALGVAEACDAAEVFINHPASGSESNGMRAALEFFSEAQTVHLG